MAVAYIDLTNLDHDPALARALGNMVVAWANAETALVLVLSVVTQMHFNMATAAYYRIPTFEARVKVILGAIEQWQVDPSKRDHYTKSVTALKKLAETRNGWVHGVWCEDKRTKATAVMNLRKPMTIERVKPVKAHDVEKHNETVRLRTKALNQLSPLKIALKS